MVKLNTLEFNAEANRAIDEWNRSERATRPILVTGFTLENLEAAQNPILLPLAGTNGILLRPNVLHGLAGIIRTGATPARLAEVLTNTIFASAEHVAAQTSGRVTLTREQATSMASTLLEQLRTTMIF